VSGHGLVVVNSSPVWGGNEWWSVRVARGLADRGHRVCVIWCHEVVGERVARAGLDGQRVPMRNDLDLAAVLALRGAMRAVSARAVLLTRWREYLLGGLAARLAARPRVVLGLGLRLVPRDDWKRRLTFGLADRVLVNAPEIKDSLCTRPWIPPGKVDVVVNGVDLDRWRPRWEPARQQAGLAFRRTRGIPERAPLVVTIGNLTLQKDHANLVAASDRLRVQVPGLRVLVLGEGDLRDPLQADIDRRGLKDTVTLAGFDPDPGAALAAADLFVLSSDNEGMAWVLMEAAASGLPIVTTDVSGARHCVEDGTTGRVVPIRDPEALADALAALLADAPGRHAQGRASRRLAEERLDAARMIAETEAVLFSAAARP
jgi:glycosyltransferase involved in cell wall biosynthesis